MNKEENIKNLEKWLSDYYYNYHCDGNILYKSTPEDRIKEFLSTHNDSLIDEGKLKLIRELKSWTSKQKDDANFSWESVMSHLSYIERRYESFNPII